MQALVSVSKELQTKFSCENGSLSTNRTMPEYPFLASLHYQVFQSLDAISVLQFLDSLLCHQTVVFQSDFIPTSAVLTYRVVLPV